MIEVFKDRRPLRQITIRGYFRQVAWSIWHRIELRLNRARVVTKDSSGCAEESSPASGSILATTHLHLGYLIQPYLAHRPGCEWRFFPVEPCSGCNGTGEGPDVNIGGDGFGDYDAPTVCGECDGVDRTGFAATVAACRAKIERLEGSELHPSTLTLGTRYCPAAIDFYESGEPYDRRIFEAGTAAHAVLQACGEQTNKLGEQLRPPAYIQVANATAEQLISKGRRFDGVPEPPLNADRVWRGVNLALEYLEFNPLPVGARYEVGLAVDSNWKPCRYKDGWLQHIADFVMFEERADEDDSVTVLVSDDYKSQWNAGAWMVDPEVDDPSAPFPLQSKVRALLVLAHAEKLGGTPDMLSLGVINLQTHGRFTREFWLGDPETEKLFKRWRREVATTIKAFSGKRVASPGVGCYSCPYVTACDAAKDYVGESDPVGAATSHAIAQGLRDATREPVAAMTKDGEPIEVNGGTVGYHYKLQRALEDETAVTIADEWEQAGGDIRGFALALGIGVGNLVKFAKVFKAAEDPKEVDKYVAGLTRMVRVKRFGIVKEDPTC